MAQREKPLCFGSTKYSDKGFICRACFMHKECKDIEPKKIRPRIKVTKMEFIYGGII